MAIDFPSSPTVGQLYTYAGITYTFTSQGIWSTTGSVPLIPTPTIQIFTSGSGTYTKPAAALWLEVELVGGGAGGAAGNNSATSGAGGNTTFGSFTAGGASGSPNFSSGAGGVATGGTINITGAQGAAGVFNNAPNGGVQASGGIGGAGPFGGCGTGAYGGTGSNAPSNSGGGGGGGGVPGTGTIASGAGGAAGAYCYGIIPAPAATYSYSVGAGGAGAPPGNFAGGNGGSGLIIVKEYYGPVATSNFISNTVTTTFGVGFTFVPFNAGTMSSGSFVPQPALGNYQYYMNNGAHTLAAPTADCAIDIMVTNGASAGAITFSGFTVGSTGDSLTVVNGNRFIIHITRINSVATYMVKALQ